MDPEWSQSSVRPLNGHAVPGGSGRSSPTLSQDSGAPGLSEDNLGDKLADKLRPGLSEDNLGDKLADKLSHGIVRGQSGRETILRYRIPGPWEDNLGDKLADKLRPRGRIGDNSALQDSGAPGLSEDNLGDKLADKLRLGGPDWRQFCFRGDNSALQDFGPREDNLGDKLADKLGDNLGPEARIGDNSALQDSGAPGGQSGRQIGGQTEAHRPGLETILRYRISGPGRTIWATNWRTNWATI